jgi:hypothetical protein
MSYTSPLGRLPVKKTAKEHWPAIVPTELRLPDGRRFPTQTLTNRVADRVTINLLTRKQTPVKTQPRPYKYTIEERIWQSQASPEQIAERYGITVKQARDLTYSSRYIIEKLGIECGKKTTDQ